MPFSTLLRQMKILLQNRKASDSLISFLLPSSSWPTFKLPCKMWPPPTSPPSCPQLLLTSVPLFPSGSSLYFTDSSFSSNCCLQEGLEVGLDILFFPWPAGKNPHPHGIPLSLLKGDTQISSHDLSLTLQSPKSRVTNHWSSFAGTVPIYVCHSNLIINSAYFHP